MFAHFRCHFSLIANRRILHTNNSLHVNAFQKDYIRQVDNKAMNSDESGYVTRSRNCISRDGILDHVMLAPAQLHNH